VRLQRVLSSVHLDQLSAMSQPSPVDHEMVQSIRAAVKDCADHGLVSASRWCVRLCSSTHAHTECLPQGLRVAHVDTQAETKCSAVSADVSCRELLIPWPPCFHACASISRFTPILVLRGFVHSVPSQVWRFPGKHDSRHGQGPRNRRRRTSHGSDSSVPR
jgi:hypothetical protein